MVSSRVASRKRRAIARRFRAFFAWSCMTRPVRHVTSSCAAIAFLAALTASVPFDAVGRMYVITHPYSDGDAHRVAGREAELPRGFLLQGRGGERRRRIAPERLGLDRCNGEMARFDYRLGGVGIALVADRQTVELAAVELHQARAKFLPIGFEQGADRPIFLAFEQLDLALAIDDQTQGDGLDATGGLGAGQLAPQDRGQRKTHQIIERAAGAVGVDQMLVQRALWTLQVTRTCDGV